ncbi:MAG: tetratricopeptide repeat protein [Bacteroidota bacterium]
MIFLKRIFFLNRSKIGFIFLFNLLVFNTFAQWWNFEDDRQKDKNEMLLQNMGVQLDVGDAVNNMYNFKFAEAERQYRWFHLKVPTHPMPYFLMGLNEWWKIVPNTDNALYDSKCLALMDSCIYYADKMYDDTKNVESAFFLAAAYAFKGRLYSERKRWTKAAFASKNALKYLEISKGKSELSPELLFGDGLYNYYSKWIPDEYPSLKPFLWFFAKGNKQVGIKQLEKTAYTAFYTRVEARYFLLQIYAMENENEKCFELAKYMHQTYPDNPYFHRYYARQSFVNANFVDAERESLEILDKIKNLYPGYEATSGRYAAYILAYVNKNVKRDPDVAKQYYKLAMDYAKQNKASDSGYYLSSELELGKMAEAAGEYEEAMNYYKDVVDKAERKSTQHEEAKKLVKTLKVKIRKKR